MTKTLQINKNLSLPVSELSFRFARSGGHGGQNVNKVETRVELLFDVMNSPVLSDEERGRVLHRLATRLDSEGILRIVSQETRSQRKNKELAIVRFVELLAHALKERKKRVKTKVPANVKRRRLDTKKKRGELKRLRKVRIE